MNETINIRDLTPAQRSIILQVLKMRESQAIHTKTYIEILFGLTEDSNE